MEEFSPVKETDTSLEIQLKEARKRAHDFQQSIKAARERDYHSTKDLGLAVLETSFGSMSSADKTSPMRSPQRQRVYVNEKYVSPKRSPTGRNGLASSSQIPLNERMSQQMDQYENIQGGGRIAAAASAAAVATAAEQAPAPARQVVTPRTFRSNFRAMDSMEQLSIVSRQNEHLTKELERMKVSLEVQGRTQRALESRLDDMSNEKELWRARCLDLHSSAGAAVALGGSGAVPGSAFNDSDDYDEDTDESDEGVGAGGWVEEDSNDEEEDVVDESLPQSGVTESRFSFQHSNPATPTPAPYAFEYQGDLTQSERKLGGLSNASQYRSLMAQAAAARWALPSESGHDLAASLQKSALDVLEPEEKVSDGVTDMARLRNGIHNRAELLPEDDADNNNNNNDDDDGGDDDTQGTPLTMASRAEAALARFVSDDGPAPTGLDTESGLYDLSLSTMRTDVPPVTGSRAFRDSIESLDGITSQFLSTQQHQQEAPCADKRDMEQDETGDSECVRDADVEWGGEPSSVHSSRPSRSPTRDNGSGTVSSPGWNSSTVLRQSRRTQETTEMAAAHAMTNAARGTAVKASFSELSAAMMQAKLSPRPKPEMNADRFRDEHERLLSQQARRERDHAARLADAERLRVRAAAEKIKRQQDARLKKRADRHAAREKISKRLGYLVDSPESVRAIKCVSSGGSGRSMMSTISTRNKNYSTEHHTAPGSPRGGKIYPQRAMSSSSSSSITGRGGKVHRSKHGHASRTRSASPRPVKDIASSSSSSFFENSLNTHASDATSTRKKRMTVTEQLRARARPKVPPHIVPRPRSAFVHGDARLDERRRVATIVRRIESAVQASPVLGLDADQLGQVAYSENDYPSYLVRSTDSVSLAAALTEEGRLTPWAKSEVLTNLGDYEFESRVPEDYLKYMETGRLPGEPHDRSTQNVSEGSDGGDGGGGSKVKVSSGRKGGPRSKEKKSHGSRPARRAMIVPNVADADNIRSRIAAHVNASAHIQHMASKSGIRKKGTSGKKSKKR